MVPIDFEFNLMCLGWWTHVPGVAIGLLVQLQEMGFHMVMR